MKRKVFLLSSCIILLLLIYIVSANVNKEEDVFKKSDQFHSFNLVEAVSQNLGTLNITVDPRIELLTVVQQQAKYDVLTRFDFDYKDKMKEHFKKYKNHKAVKTFHKLSKKGFSYDAPPNLMLNLSSNLNLKENNILPKDLTGRISGENEVFKFIDELRDFTVKSDFNKYYEQNIPFYQAMIDNVYKDIKDMELIEKLDDYYGMGVNSYNLILAPMLHAGGYGPRVEAENGLYDVYGIIGPQSIMEDINRKIVPVYSSETIRYIVWHEFSHSFINPITENHIDEINKYNNLYSKIKNQMSSQAYPSWEISVNEHIIRAITARLVYLDQGQSAYDAIIANEITNGFYYVPALCESFALYEISRDDYPTLESYYPEIIKVFKELSEQNLDDDFFKMDFLGPINAAFINKDSMKVAIIVSTQEEDAKIQEGIYSYVEKIKSKFFPKAEIINDTDAVTLDLSDYIILAYGTMEGNLWLEEHKDIFPFKVEEDKIIADKTYEDTGMIMISAMPNPQNYKNPLLIYTAQDAKDIIDINSIFHGPTDYIVAKDGEELHSGFYNKDKETWSFQ
ncbi:DUF4932 domain-containing protein [Tissierella sp.]|uniref:DUF4932 domain-containing protein n=1 Tax=Tissierella sp. TaxID=41274 RepID=UPI0028629EBC|nr:DUF4932 domain-containing protein [Tissierella sp.]MDR7855968.1 DUF4932 domain-containing protein [Tissierella sp.]